MIQFDRKLRDLCATLADLYLDKDRSRVVVERAGLRPGAIRFDNRADQNWHNIIDEARKHPGKIEEIITCALEDYPGNNLLLHILEGNLVVTDIPWQTPTFSGNAEAILGHKSTLIPIHFLELGIQRSLSVGLIRIGTGSSRKLGSGFLVERNLLVTNWHVIAELDEAANASVTFNYQQTASGAEAQPEEYRLDPDSYFRCSEKDDWCIVKVRGEPNQTWGAIPLVEVDVGLHDRVNIIQHPRGGHKKLSLFHNLVTYVGAGRIQYLTDTEPGSSGSPVFDADWRLVGVHHAGGLLDSELTSGHYVRNEGIHINVVARALET